MKRLTFTLLTLIALFSAISAVEDLPVFRQWIPDDMVTRPPVYHWTLDNGLEVLFWENHTVPLVASYIMIKAGGAFETKFDGAGISHYCEHLVSGGTTSKHTENEYKQMVQELGVSTNAYTSADVTVYHNSGPAKNFVPMFTMLAEQISDAKFVQEEVDREKGVIINEINMGQEEPGRVIWKLYNELFYRVNPYRLPTIGFVDRFEALTRDDVLEYYNMRYVPNNAILAIAGDVGVDKVKAVVDSVLGGWERKLVEPVNIPIEPLPVAARIGEREMDVEVSTMRMGFPTVYYGEEDLPALRVLGMILSGVQTSRLDLRLVNNDNPIMHSISAYSMEKYRERGQFMLGGGFDYENRDAIIETIWEEIDKIKEKGVTSDEVEWAKQYMIKSLKRESETVDDQAQNLLYNMLNTGRAFALDFYIMRINRVTAEDCQRVAKKYLVPEHMIMAIIKPFGATAPLDSMLVSDKSSSRPEFEIRELDNGLKLILAENPAQATVDMAVYIMGGSIFEPPEKAGLAEFTANFLAEGTKKYRTFEKLQRKQDELAIMSNIAAGSHTIYLTANFVATDLIEAIDLGAEVLINPTFPKSSEEKLKMRQLARIQQSHSSWASDAFQFYRENFFGEHPYSRPTIGYENAVSELTAADAKKYWSNTLNPRNMVIAISGPISVDVMAKELEKKFGKIKPKTDEMATIPMTVEHSQAESFEKEVDRGQVTLLIGYDACDSRDEEDKWALRAATGLLNGTGGLSGWIPMTLRGERDLVYVAWSSYSGRLFGGDFYLATQCQPENLEEVDSILLSLLDKLKTGDFTDEELQIIENAMAEQFLFSKERQADIVTDAGLNELYGFGIDYSDKFPEKIRAVTKDDVIRVAKKYLNNPVTVMLKPRAEMQD